ncbi:MAG: hypothetical protein ACD_71C00104G0008 [uncultured bacterium (gcode 4)]|uniref:Uncharacterized protein n=1 Tax=uncultured bacterium (gcode 4) TaxID=1234023 RepID=K1Z5P0_9BACT|nr:MAG: hypothetical protein ACD_71C00104G0008 [uncultured bacterium (gcode 4)]
MIKIIVHFLPEWMNITFLLKRITRGGSLWWNISGYLKENSFEINYFEYLFIKWVCPNFFKKYNLTFHNHGKLYSHCYVHENLLDGLIRYSQVYEFHENINYKTRDRLRDEKSISQIIELIHDRFNIPEIFEGLLKYKKIYWTIFPHVHLYANTLFLIYLSKEYRIITLDTWVMELMFVPSGDFQTSLVKAEKIIYTDFSLRNISHFLHLIKERSFENIFFITNNPNSNERKISFFKNKFLAGIRTGIGVKIYKPFDCKNIHLSENNLFIIFEDSKAFFDLLSYPKNYGILCFKED